MLRFEMRWNTNSSDVEVLIFDGAVAREGFHAPDWWAAYDRLGSAMPGIVGARPEPPTTLTDPEPLSKKHQDLPPPAAATTKPIAPKGFGGRN